MNHHALHDGVCSKYCMSPASLLVVSLRWYPTLWRWLQMTAVSGAPRIKRARTEAPEPEPPSTPSAISSLGYDCRPCPARLSTYVPPTSWFMGSTSWQGLYQAPCLWHCEVRVMRRLPSDGDSSSSMWVWDAGRGTHQGRRLTRRLSARRGDDALRP